MGEETIHTEYPTKGILKNKVVKEEEKRVPVTEPLIVPEKATILCPTDGPKDPACTPSNTHKDNGSSSPTSDNTTREFLIQKRSSLTHTPDIARVFGQNAQKLSSGNESLHEFQKVKLRHVENTSGVIPDTLMKTEERRKDVIVKITAGPCKYNFGTGTKMPLESNASSGGRKSSYEGYRPFGERSSSFTQMVSSPMKRDSIPKEMSTSMYTPSTQSNNMSNESAPSIFSGRKPLITRGGSNTSSISKSSEEKRSSIVRESLNKSTDNSTESSAKEKNIKKSSLTSPPGLSKRSNSITEAREDKKKQSSVSETTKDVTPKKAPPSSTNKAVKTSASKENKRPTSFGQKKDNERKGLADSTKDDKKPMDRSVRKTPSFKKSQPPLSSSAAKPSVPKKANEPVSKKPISMSKSVPSSSESKKTPEVRRRVVQKPSTVDREAMRSKSRQSPSPALRRKAPSPSGQRKPKKKEESSLSGKAEEDVEEPTKRPERVSGIFRPTQSWLCYMGDKVDVKSRTPSPGVKPSTPSSPRKRSSGDRKVSAPIRRTESFDKKKSSSKANSEAPLKRSSSLRSSTGREAHSEHISKRNSLKKSNPPPTLPKPGKQIVSSHESAPMQDSGIEETSIKASSVIQKFEAGKGSLGRTSILGSQESNVEPISNRSLLLSSGISSVVDAAPSKFTPSKGSINKSSLLSSSSLSPTMVTNEEYSSQKMQSHSRSGSVASGDNGLSNNGGGYQSAEKYKTTMVVRLHPGQTRRLSNCSTTTADSQTHLNNSGSFTRDATSSSTRKYSTISNSSIGSISSSVSQQGITQQHRYSADIHGFECEKTESNSCCASGLEITFESPPQTIDIKLIPSPSVEERKALENEDDGNNLISQEQTDKTRQ